MARLEITIKSKSGRRPVAHEEFEISLELAQELITALEALVTELPGQHRITRTVRPNGVTVVEIELNREPSPPPVRPNFTELFRQGGSHEADR